ncbi:MAG: FG-GAP repeat protein [Pirellulales bacterium]
MHSCITVIVRIHIVVITTFLTVNMLIADSQTLNDPTVTTRDLFGGSVALDGVHALIGAGFDDTNGENAGQAHLFNVTTGEFVRTFNAPTPTMNDKFGTRVAIDGDNALIADWRDDDNGDLAGETHLFDALTGDLLHVSYFASCGISPGR